MPSACQAFMTGHDGLIVGNLDAVGVQPGAQRRTVLRDRPVRLVISCSDTLSRKCIRRILPNISMVITLFVPCPKFRHGK
jgi:hypothetical protein